MKLESLKSSKFEAFKGSELQTTLKTIGGEIKATEESINLGYGDLVYSRDRYDTEHGCTEYWDFNKKAWV
jgi:hypothetical protein